VAAEVQAAANQRAAEALRKDIAALADEWEEDSRDALKIGAAARDRGDREMHRISARHARVAHHAASQLRAALAQPAPEERAMDELTRVTEELGLYE
jgi:hypothetical protein